MNEELITYFDLLPIEIIDLIFIKRKLFPELLALSLTFDDGMIDDNSVCHLKNRYKISITKRYYDLFIIYSKKTHKEKPHKNSPIYKLLNARSRNEHIIAASLAVYGSIDTYKKYDLFKIVHYNFDWSYYVSVNADIAKCLFFWNSTCYINDNFPNTLACFGQKDILSEMYGMYVVSGMPEKNTYFKDKISEYKNKTDTCKKQLNILTTYLDKISGLLRDVKKGKSPLSDCSLIPILYNDVISTGISTPSVHQREQLKNELKPLEHKLKDFLTTYQQRINTFEVDAFLRGGAIGGYVDLCIWAKETYKANDYDGMKRNTTYKNIQELADMWIESDRVKFGSS